MGNEHSKNKDPSKCDQNGGLNGLAVNITSNGFNVNSLTLDQQNSRAEAFDSAAESDYGMVESDSGHEESEAVPQKTAAAPQTKEAEKHEGKVRLFGQIFKKKSELEAPVDAGHVAEKGTKDNIETDASLPQLETANQKPEALTEPDAGTREQTDNANGPSAQEETNPEESPVMNFFKNLNLTVSVPSLVRQMTPTKTSKKEAPEVQKDQRQREKQPPAPTATVAQVSDPPAASKGMLIPPPPPPELPKVEVKVEPSGKVAKTTASKEKNKAVAKSAESPKAKPSKDILSKFFRPKTNKETQLQAVEAQVNPIVEKQETPMEVPQVLVEVKAEEAKQAPEEPTAMLVEEKKADPCQAGSVEVAARPEPQAPLHEEKKNPSKSSFFSLFKPKPSEPKKVSAAHTPPALKSKEEPKVAPKSCEVLADVKVASVAPKASDTPPNAAGKSEKRNSIQLFLKHLGQKRHSTDAGVQTEPVSVAPAAK